MPDADEDLRRSQRQRNAVRDAEAQRERAESAIAFAHQLAEIVPILVKALADKKLLTPTMVSRLTAIETQLGDRSARSPARAVADLLKDPTPPQTETKRETPKVR